MSGRSIVYSSGLCALCAVALLLSSANCSSGSSGSAKPAAAASQAAIAAPPPEASENTAALQEAVVAYVRDVKGLDTSKMEVVMKDQAMTGTTAEATVAFKIKRSEMAPMTYQYTFEKSGEAWKVVSSKPASGEGHGAMPVPSMPEGHPPVGGQPAGTGPAGMASGHTAPLTPVTH